MWLQMYGRYEWPIPQAWIISNKVDQILVTQQIVDDRKRIGLHQNLDDEVMHQCIIFFEIFQFAMITLRVNGLPRGEICLKLLPAVICSVLIHDQRKHEQAQGCLNPPKNHSILLKPLLMVRVRRSIDIPLCQNRLIVTNYVGDMKDAKKIFHLALPKEIDASSFKRHMYRMGYMTLVQRIRERISTVIGSELTLQPF